MPLGLIWRTARENAGIRALAAVARRIGPSAAGPQQAMPRAPAPQAELIDAGGASIVARNALGRGTRNAASAE